MYINANDNSCLELFTTVWVVNVFYNCLINSKAVKQYCSVFAASRCDRSLTNKNCFAVLFARLIH